MNKKNNVSSERWKIAQDSEKSFWNSFSTEEIVKNHERAYKKEIEIFSNRWKKFIPLNENIKVLQIGCGPLDIINYLPFGKKYSIDPLADFYKKKFNFDYSKSHLIQGSGEELPFEDNSFDLVLLANVLDHTNNPGKVLSEVKRVLKREGILHFECAFYQKSFLFLSRIYGPLKKMFTKEIFNINHPYMFSLSELKKLVKKYFIIKQEKMGERIGLDVYSLKDFKKFKKKQKLTAKIPAYFGILGNINYFAICKKC